MKTTSLTKLVRVDIDTLQEIERYREREATAWEKAGDNTYAGFLRTASMPRLMKAIVADALALQTASPLGKQPIAKKGR